MFKSNTTICYLPRDTFDLWYIVLVIQLNYSLLFVSFFLDLQVFMYIYYSAFVYTSDYVCFVVKVDIYCA